MTPSLRHSDIVIDDDLLSHVARIRRQRSDDALVEAKAAVRDLPKSIWGTISAFANTDGGTVILGLDEREGFQPAEGFTESVANRRINALITGLNTVPCHRQGDSERQLPARRRS